jgi:hypothetical protein
VSSGAEPFAVEEAIDIGLESARTIRPDFRADIKMDFDDDLRLHGAQLTVFVDILFIILENITKHAGDGLKPSATIGATLRGTSLRINVENPVSPEIVTDERRAMLKRLKSAVLDQQHAAFVRQEGGSGFHKLARILQDDLGGGPQLDFGFKSESTFFVTVTMPIRVLSNEITPS